MNQKIKTQFFVDVKIRVIALDDKNPRGD